MIPEDTEKNGKNTLAKNAAWMFAGQGMSFVIQGAYFIVLARLLGAAQYGIFVGVTALVSIASQYSSMGSGFVFLRHVSPDRKRFPEYWGNVLLSTFTIGTLLVAGLWIAGPFLVKGEAVAILLFAAIGDCLCTQLTACAGQVFQAFERMSITAAINLSNSVMRFSLALAMFARLGKATAFQWAVGSLVVSAIATLLAVVVVTTRFGWPRFRPALLFSSLGEGFVFAVSGSTTSVYNDIDKAMLAHNGMNVANGIYAMAYRVVDIATMPIRSIHNAAFPRFFRYGVNGVAHTEAFARRILKRTTLFGVAAAVGMFLAAPLLPMIVGKGFAGSVSALRWLCLIPLFRCFHLSAGDAMAGAGFQKYRLASQMAAAGMNFGLNLYLIPHFSWVGAAWASLATDGGLGLLQWLVLLRLKATRGCAPVPSLVDLNTSPAS